MSETENIHTNMEVQQSQQAISLNSKRFTALHNLLERPGPYCRSDFAASRESLEFLQNGCTVLVIGAGGLGCEMLKDLALMGFGDIHVIDMDTIDLSNLNRQFLFRRSDIGESKAKVAANFISKRIPTAKVTAYFAKIQDFDANFYQKFHLIICGLDSIPARRWINGMLISLLSYEEDGTLDTSSIIPLIDGGTEGFKGNVRVVFPGLTACIECTLGLYAPQVTYPLCTIASKPRLPEHCVEYVKLMQWQQENPFNVQLDADDPQHLSWVYERALERANQYNITGVTYRLVQGVLKHIIPAVASTNATIASVCVNEAFKLVTSCYDNLTNFLMYNNLDGIYTYVFEAEKLDNCLACSNVPQVVNVANADTMLLKDLRDHLCESPQFQMKSPALTTTIDGKSKTLYLPNIKSLEEATRANLKKTLKELGLQQGQLLVVTDETSPRAVTIQLKFLIKSQNNDVEML